MSVVDSFFTVGKRSNTFIGNSAGNQILPTDGFQLNAEAKIRRHNGDGGGGGGGSSSNHRQKQHNNNNHHHSSPPSPQNNNNNVNTWKLNTALEQQPTLEDILILIEEKGEHFNAINCATALNKVSRFAFKQRNAALVASDPRFDLLMKQTFHQLESSGPAQQNQFLSALARLGVIPETPQLDLLLKKIEADVHAYRSIELAGLLNAMARLSTSSIWPSSLLGLLRDRAINVVPEGSAPIIANVYCSLCKLGYAPGQELTLTVAEQFMSLDLRELDSHWLAQVLNCMSRASVDPGYDFLQSCRDETLRRMNTMGPLDLAMVTSSLAKLRHVYNPNDLFFFSVADHVCKRGAHFGSPQALSLLTNGLGNLVNPHRGPPEHLVFFLLDLASSCLEQLKPQEIANVLGGLGKLKARPSSQFLRRVSEIVLHRMEAFSPADLSNTIFGLVRMKFIPTAEFMDRVREYCEVVIKRQEQRGGAGVDARELAHLLQTFVRLGIDPEEEMMSQLTKVLVTDSTRATAAGGGGSSLVDVPLQSLAMIVVGMARFKHNPGTKFLEQVAQIALGGSSSATTITAPPAAKSALHLALLIHGLNRLGHEPTRHQLNYALTRVSPRLHELAPKCLFNLLWSLAKWAHPCSDSAAGQTFLQAWSNQAPEILEDLTTSQVVVTAWSLAQVGYIAPPKVKDVFYRVITARSPAAITDGEAASLLHSLWGIGINTREYPSILLVRGQRARGNGGGGGGEGGRGSRRQGEEGDDSVDSIGNEEGKGGRGRERVLIGPLLLVEEGEGYLGAPANVSSLSRGNLL